MKEIIAVVRMNRTNATKKALIESGAAGFTALKVMGRGRSGRSIGVLGHGSTYGDQCGIALQSPQRARGKGLQSAVQGSNKVRPSEARARALAVPTLGRGRAGSCHGAGSVHAQLGLVLADLG